MGLLTRLLGRSEPEPPPTERLEVFDSGEWRNVDGVRSVDLETAQVADIPTVNDSPEARAWLLQQMEPEQ